MYDKKKLYEYFKGKLESGKTEQEAVDMFLEEHGYDLVVQQVPITVNEGDIGRVKQAKTRVFTDDPKVLRAVREAYYILQNEFSDHTHIMLNKLKPMPLRDEDLKVVVDEVYAMGMYHKALPIDLPSDLDNPDHIWALAIMLYRYINSLYIKREQANNHFAVLPTYELD